MKPRYPLLTGLVVLALLLHGLAFVVHGALMVSGPYEIDFGEGPVLQLAYQVHQGEPLYRSLDEPPFQACLYTPLYIGLASLLQGEHPSLGAARALSALATLIAAAATSIALKNRHGWLVSLTFLALFLGHALTLNWSFYCRVDTLALMFSVLGLLAAAPDWRRPLAQEAAVALCLSLAVLTKQSFLAAPVAIFLLWLPRPLRALRLTLFCVLFTGLTLLWLNASSQGQLFNQLFRYNALPYYVAQMTGYLKGYTASAGALMGLALLGALPAWRTERVFLLYTLTSLGIVLGSGRMFSWYNYFLELHLAMAVLAGLAVQRWAPDPVTRGAVAVLLAGQLFWLGLTSDLNGTYLEPAGARLKGEVWPVLTGRTPARVQDRIEQARRLQEMLQRHPGPLLAEYSALPLCLGRTSWLCDPSTYCALSGLGWWNQKLLTDQFEERRFDLILLTWKENSPHFTREAMEALKANYVEVGHTGGTGAMYYFVRRP